MFSSSPPSLLPPRLGLARRAGRIKLGTLTEFLESTIAVPVWCGARGADCEMAALAAPGTASERLEALHELRSLLRKNAKSPATKYFLAQTLDGIEKELQSDLDELRQLQGSAQSDAVQRLLRENADAIESSLTSSDSAADADDEDEPSSSPNKTSVAAAAPALAKPTPTKSAPAKPAPATASTVSNPTATSATTPPGGFEPAEWPIASTEGLPADCWRSSHQPLRQVPRCAHGSKAAMALMEQRKPVIITQSPLVAKVAGKWRLDYLRANLSDVPCTVYASHTRHFRYWDDEKNTAGFAFPESMHTQKLTMSIEAFSEKLRSATATDGSGAAAAAAEDAGELRHYLQTALVEGVGSELAADFAGLDWDALLAIQRRLGWDDLSSNLLLVGQMGNTTPAHYDEQQNLFAQLGACDCPRALPWCHACHRRQRPARAAWSSSRPVARDLLHMDHCPCLPDADGRKRVVLFSPADFGSLYPFPVHHPCDRQSQVDLYAADLTRFPRFPEARPLQAILEPGELLYIPQYWWHHIENLSDECVSLNFWFKDQSKPQKVTLPLSEHQHLAMRRNIEKMIAAELGPKAAQAALPLLAKDGEDLAAALRTPEGAGGAAGAQKVAAVRAEVVRLLSHVLAEKEIEPWLRELTEGRFDTAPLSLGDGSVV